LLDVNDWFKTKSACSTLMCFLSHHGTIPHLITTQRVRRCDPTGGYHSKNTSASNTAYLSVTSLITWSDRCGGDTQLTHTGRSQTIPLCCNNIQKKRICPDYAIIVHYVVFTCHTSCAVGDEMLKIHSLPQLTSTFEVFCNFF